MEILKQDLHWEAQEEDEFDDIDGDKENEPPAGQYKKQESVSRDPFGSFNRLDMGQPPPPRSGKAKAYQPERLPQIFRDILLLLQLALCDIENSATFGFRRIFKNMDVPLVADFFIDHILPEALRVLDQEIISIEDLESLPHCTQAQILAFACYITVVRRFDSAKPRDGVYSGSSANKNGGQWTRAAM